MSLPQLVVRPSLQCGGVQAGVLGHPRVHQTVPIATPPDTSAARTPPGNQSEPTIETHAPRNKTPLELQVLLATRSRKLERKSMFVFCLLFRLKSFVWTTFRGDGKNFKTNTEDSRREPKGNSDWKVGWTLQIRGRGEIARTQTHLPA